MKKLFVKLGVCFALLLSMLTSFTGVVFASNEGVSVDKNTTGLSDAKYQATFVFDASNLSKEVDNVQLEGGFQFIKESDDHLYEENKGSNSGIIGILLMNIKMECTQLVVVVTKIEQMLNIMEVIFYMI